MYILRLCLFRVAAEVFFCIVNTVLERGQGYRPYDSCVLSILLVDWIDFISQDVILFPEYSSHVQSTAESNHRGPRIHFQCSRQSISIMPLRLSYIVVVLGKSPDNLCS